MARRKLKRFRCFHLIPEIFRPSATNPKNTNRAAGFLYAAITYQGRCQNSSGTIVFHLSLPGFNEHRHRSIFRFSHCESTADPAVDIRSGSKPQSGFPSIIYCGFFVPIDLQGPMSRKNPYINMHLSVSLLNNDGDVKS